MQRILESFGIRQREVSTAALMTAYFFLAMAAVSIVKSVQNAVYLGRVGFDWRLPSLCLVLALFSMGVASLMGHLAQRYSRVALNAWTLFFLTLWFPPFFILLNSNTTFAYPVLYVFGGIFSVLVPTQGWMLSYDLFSYRQAKRLFSLLGTGGILGGAGGGYYAAGLASFGIESHWLLIHVCVILVGMQALLFRLRRSPRISADSPSAGNHEGRPDRPFSALRSSSYLRYLAGLVLMSACLSTMIDLQYKWVLEEKYPGSPTEITQFFGYLLGTMFIFSALFQLLATSRILRRFGVAFTTMALPVALFLGAVPVVVLAAFGAVVAVKLIDGCLRTSLHKTSTELLFIPVLSEGTFAVKGFIDLVVFRVGDAIAAAIFLAIISLASVPLKTVGIAMMVTAAIWFLIAKRLSWEYLRGLRGSLELGATNPALQPKVTLETDAEAALVAALRSGRPNKIRFALGELIRRMPERRERFRAPVDDDVVYRLLQSKPPPWIESIQPLLDHADQEIAAAALHLVVVYEPDKHRDRLDSLFLSGIEPSLLSLTYLDRYSDYDPGPVEVDRFVEWSRNAGPTEMRALASLMGRYPRVEFKPILLDWIESGDRELVQVSLEALGSYRAEEDRELLLRHLEQDWSRVAARRALSISGDLLIPDLSRLGQDLRVPPEIRREVPLILTEVGSASAQEALLALLYMSDPLVSHRALKGLNKIRKTRKLVFGEEALLPILQVWVQNHYQLLNLDQMLVSNPRSREEKLLKKTVQERLFWSTEKIFRGLELFLPAGDAYFSYLGFTGRDPALRENAVELLDLRVRGELRKTVLPILTGRDTKKVAQRGRELFNLSSDYDRVLSDTLFIGDPWLKCCVIAVVLVQRRHRLHARVVMAVEDVHPVVRETAHWALEAWPARE